MPLSKRARIEIYLPERKGVRYSRLLRALQSEFLHTFGGCTLIKDTKGLYKGADKKTDVDRISLLYTDTMFDSNEHFSILSKYIDSLRGAVLDITGEESILIVVHEIYHSV